jgi:hypothetical protein
MSVLRSLRALVFGETWIIPLGVGATLALSVALRSELSERAWHHAGGFIVAGLATATLLLSLRRGDSRAH